MQKGYISCCATNISYQSAISINKNAAPDRLFAVGPTKPSLLAVRAKPDSSSDPFPRPPSMGRQTLLLHNSFSRGNQPFQKIDQPSIQNRG